MSLSLDEQYDKIYRYCYFKVKNQQIAEDLTQEAFLKFIKQNTYINKGKQLAYLYTIARNLCFDNFKKIQEYELDQEIPDNAQIDNLEVNLVLKQAILTLTQEEQEIILMRYSNDLGVGEIGVILGISRFAVHRKLKSALEVLRENLSKEDLM